MTCTKCGTELVEGALYCHMCGRAADWQPSRKKRGNRQGTARKRGKTWTGYSPGYSYTEVDADGNAKVHRVRPSKGGFRTKAEALAWAANASPADRQAPTLEHLWQVYSEGAMQSLSHEAQVHYKAAYKSLLPFMPRRIDTITLTELQEHFTRTYTASTGKHAKALVSILYQMAMADNGPTGRITNNLARYIKLPAHTARSASILTRAEIDAIWGAYSAGDGTAPVILLMLYTGMMPAEVLKLTPGMIDTETREIRGAGAKTKTRKDAVIIYPEFLDGVVSAMIGGAGPDGPVVTISQSMLQRNFFKLLESVGIDNPVDDRGVHRLTLYSCRHTYGTEAVRMGLPPAMVAKLMRHSNTQTQQRYTHLADEDVRQAVSKMKK